MFLTDSPNLPIIAFSAWSSETVIVQWPNIAVMGMTLRFMIQFHLIGPI